MPGLFGWIDLEQPTASLVPNAPALLDEMGDRMRHTGDEVVDTWRDAARGFVIARIAPRALGSSRWPPAGEGDRAFVDGVLHGTPVQVEDLLGEIARRGHTALPALRGFFTVARWEPATRRLMLAVDRRASRPLAFTVAGGRLYFAPEVKALLAVPCVDKTIDEAAMGVFLGAGYLLSHQTLFTSIRRLSGGEALIVEPSRRRIEPYWRYRLHAGGDGTRPRELEQEMAALLRQAVERNVDDVDRTVVFLSGGVDSRAIAEAAQDAARRDGKRVQTVTWASPRSRLGADLDVAHKVARALGTRHRAVLREVCAWGARLDATTYLLDGLTDVPAYHAYEYSVMRDLAASGARTVLRGDECFGWVDHVHSIDEAVLSLNLRALGELKHLDRVVRPGVYGRLCEASSTALEAAADPLRGAHPDDAKDLLYFRHRLQSYLGSAAYLKHVTLDHRAPLVDEALLDFNLRVPAGLRVNKELFYRAAARGAEALWRIPFAKSGNLEDWDELLCTESPVRMYVDAQLADQESGVWSLLDPRALAAMLPSIRAPRGHREARRREAVQQVCMGLKRVARVVLRVAPPVERRVVVARQRAGIRPTQICMRAMVLKSWYDHFVAGDGSRGSPRG